MFMNSANGGQDDSSRRSFLLSGGGLLTGVWIAAHWPAIAAAAHHAELIPAVPDPAGFQFFNVTDAADVEAISGQIVPGGVTPGAREAHAVYFIDRALSTFFAAWSADFRSGLGEFQAKFHAADPEAASFAAASSETQIAFMKKVDRTPFFESTRMLTIL